MAAPPGPLAPARARVALREGVREPSRAKVASDVILVRVRSVGSNDHRA